MFNQKEYAKKYYQNHKEKMDEQKKKWNREHREILLGQKKQWYRNNKEYYKKYHQEHKKERNEYDRNRRKTNLKYKINHNLKGEIRKSLKCNKNSKYWENLVGYTLVELAKRLGRTIPEGYTWQDYINGELQIDHIIPISAFNFTKPEHPDFKKCWALSNLQLLPARENILKSNKLNKPFQPALKIEL